MAMRVWSSMAHGYPIECATRDGREFRGLVHACTNDHASRRAEDDRGGSNLTVRFKDGRTVALEDLSYVQRAAI
jgi:hypothetical protein